jgi:hypothetical protein
MAWFRVWNKSPSVPVHVVVSWAGIIQHYHNDLRPGEYCEWHVPGLGWHDFTAIPSNGANQVDPAHDNIPSIAKFVIGGLSLGAVAVGGVIAFLPSGGSSVVFALGAGAAIVSGLTFTGDAVVSGIDAALHPASVSNLYGPDGYNIEVRGGEVTGHTENGKLLLTSYKPLVIHWHNNQSGTHGDEFAAHGSPA